MADNNSTSRSAGLAISRPLARNARLDFPRAAAQVNPILGLVTRAFGSQENRVAARDFVEGLAGIEAPRPISKLGEKRQGSVTIDLPLAAKRSAPRAAGAKAATAKAAAEAPLSPQEKQLALLDTMFSKPLTTNQIVALTGALPRAPKGPTPTDEMNARTEQTSQALYAAALARATEVEQSDPEEGRNLKLQALKDHYDRQAAFSGANVLGLAQAGMLQSRPEDN